MQRMQNVKSRQNAKNNETAWFWKLTIVAHRFHLISGSWVRLPDGALKNALHESVGRFLLLFFKKAQSVVPLGILEQGGGTQVP